MGNQQTEFELNCYPLGDNEYIGKIWLDDEKTQNSTRTLVILDSSGSMGDATRRFVNIIIPLVMSMLSYAPDAKIDLITFESKTTHRQLTVDEMKSLAIQSGGGTRIAPAIKKLRECLNEAINQPIRVLSISDGEISDRDETETEIKDLVKYLDEANLTINSQAVRLFTSKSQPDSKALAGLLQINNATACQLVDVRASESDDAIAQKIAALFKLDNFESCKTLTVEKNVILKFPWNTIPSMKVILVPGWNIFWLKFLNSAADKMTAKVGARDIKIIWHADIMRLDFFQELMRTNLAYIINQIIILKVLGTAKADKTVAEIMKYFEMMEEKLARSCSVQNNKKITNQVAKIAYRKLDFDAKNNEKIAEFISKANAEFERLCKKEEYEEKRRKEDEDKRKREEEERKRKKEEERKREEEEHKRKEEEKRKREEEERKREEQERKRKEEEHKRKEEQKRKREEEERKREEQESKRKEEEDKRKREEERKRIEEEEERKREEEHKRKEEEKHKQEEEECKRKEEQRKREEEDCKRKEEEQLKREEEESKRKEEQRKRKEEEEECKRKEEERKREEAERKRKEEERKRAEEESKRKEEERKREEEQRRRDEEEAKLKLKKEADEQRKREEEHRIELQKLAEEQRKRDEEKKEVVAADEKIATADFEKTRKLFSPEKRQNASLITKFMGAIGMWSYNSVSIETVIILEETASSSTERLTEKLIPLVLSKRSDENQQRVHLLTFVRDKPSVVQKLQSLFQTLDANKRIQILFLTYEDAQHRIDHFAEALIKFLTASNFASDLQVVRLASECRQTFRINNVTTKYKLFDINANESDEFIATRIAGLFHSDSFTMHKQLRMDKQIYKIDSHSTAMVAECDWDGGVGDKLSEDLHILDYVVGAEVRPRMQKIQMERMERRVYKTEEAYDAFEAIFFIIILFFLLFLIFHLLYYCYVIFK